MTSLNEVDLANGTVEVVEFTQTNAALAELHDKYSCVPDANTREGYEFVKAGVKELTGLRTMIEAKRKEVKEPYIEAGKIIDSEAKRIIAALTELETPLKAAKKEVDDAEKRMKEERIARLTAKIQAIRDHVGFARGKSSAEIAEMIDHVSAIDATQDYYELTSDAVNARAETLETLGELYNDRLSFEENERLRIEEQKKRQALEAEQAIDARINKLRMMPMDFLQSDAAVIQAKINSLVSFEPKESDFGARVNEVRSVMDMVLTQLNAMLVQRKSFEAMQPKPVVAEVVPECLGAPKVERKAKEEPKIEEVPEGPAVVEAKPDVTLLVTIPEADYKRFISMLGSFQSIIVQEIS